MGKKQLIGIYVVMFVLITASYNVIPDISITIGIFFSFFSFFLFCKQRERIVEINSIYLRPVHLFLISYLIVFFQKPLDYVWGYSPRPSGIGGVDNMSTCVYFSVVGLLLFFVGYLITDWSRSLLDFSNYTYVKRKYTASPLPFCVISTLLIVVVYITTPMAVLMGGYGSDFTAGGNLVNYLLSWTNTFIITSLIQHALCRMDGRSKGITLWQYIKDIGWWQNFNIILYSITILNIGDRGPLIIIAVAYYIVYVLESGIAPPKKLMILIIILSTVFFTILGFTKKLRDNNTVFDRLAQVDEVEEAETTNTFSPNTAELAASYQCLSYSIYCVPRLENFKYGGYQFAYIWGAIPFGSRLLKTAGTSSSQITYFIQGPYPTHGNGSSCLADLYLDGGFIAIVIGMFCFGVIIRKFEYEMFCNKEVSLFWLCLGVYIGAHSVYIPRAMLLFFIKYALWMFVIIKIYNRDAEGYFYSSPLRIK